MLATALEQSLPLLRMLPEGRDRDGVLALLDTFTSVPSLAVIAAYARPQTIPAWEVSYPEAGGLQLISNESSKRPGGIGLTLVVQGKPGWSHQRLEQPPEAWSRALLDEAALRLGPWAAGPDHVHPHRWRYARVDGANELTGPLVLNVGRCRLGLAGDLFAPGGGVQAAWLSGDRLAVRLAGNEGH